MAEDGNPGAELRAEALGAIDLWTERHRELLTTDICEFLRSSRWPRPAQLSELLRGHPREANLIRAWEAAPLGLFRGGEGRPFVPLARAMAVVGEARTLLQDLVEVIQMAVGCFLGSDSLAVLQGDEVRQRLGLGRERLERLTQVLWSEPGLAGVRVGGLDWAWSLDDSILQFRSATSVERYLAEQAWIIWPDGPVSAPMVHAVRHPGSPGSRLGRAVLAF